MSQYAIFIHSYFIGIPAGWHSGLTLVKYDENQEPIEARQLDLTGPSGACLFSEASFSCNIYTEQNPGVYFNFIKNNLTINMPTTEYVSQIGGLNYNYKRLVSNDALNEIWDRMVLDAALRSTGDASHYSIFTQVCNTYTVYLSQMFLGIGEATLFSKLPGYYLTGTYGEFDQWMFSENKKPDTIRNLFEYIIKNQIDIPLNKFEDWRASIVWNSFGGLEIVLNGEKYIFYSDYNDKRVINNKSDHIILLNNGRNELVNSGNDANIYGGVDQDTIINIGSDVIIDSASGADTIINTGDNVVIHAGEGSDLIQDYGGGNTTIDLGNDNAADKLILRKEDGSSTEIINAGATDQLVIQERDLLRIEQVGNDLKLVLSGAEVWMKDGVLNGPDDMLNLRRIVA